MVGIDLRIFTYSVNIHGAPTVNIHGALHVRVLHWALGAEVS